MKLRYISDSLLSTFKLLFFFSFFLLFSKDWQQNPLSPRPYLTVTDNREPPTYRRVTVYCLFT